MAAESSNPFVLPGMGQSGDAAQNPLLAGMEMMRKAWEGFAERGGFDQPGMAAPMTLEDLERRIADLRTVENWLRMNLSMLSSSIQGLEVQRATITTLRSFADAASSAQAGQGKSPLEAMLEMWAPPQRPAAADAGDASTEQGGDPLPASAQAWWDMLRGQFDAVAAATAATMQGAEAAGAAARGPKAATGRSAKPASGRAAAKSPGTKAAAAKRAAARKRAPSAAGKK